MKGTIRPISLARKLVIDAMHASVPLIAVRRTMKLDRLVMARAAQAARPNWSSIIAKAFCIVARDEPWLRPYYLKWPWPHFYELPMSVAMIVVVRDDFDSDVEGYVQRAKHAPLDEVPSFKRILRVMRMPLPLRRLL